MEWRHRVLALIFCPASTGNFVMRRVVVLLAAFLCACSTPYAERSRGAAELLGGISLSRAGQDTYRIFAQGNAYTSPMQVRNHAIRRAAKHASDSGYSGFYILETADRGTDFVVSFPAIELVVQMSNTPAAGYYRAANHYP
jgi:hypothetical protein